MSNEPRLRIEPFALALVGLLFTEHLLFGADRIDFSLLFGVLQLGLLLALILVSRGAEPPRLPLTAPAILFSLAFAIGLLSVLPVGLPLAHPLWAYVQRIEPGVAATISMDPAATRMQLVKLAGLGALFLVGASLGGRREAAERTGRYVTLAGLLYCLWAGGAFVVDPNTTFGFHRFYGMGRLSASFSSPNIAATLFASLTIWALAGLMRPLLRVRRSGEPITAAEIGRLWPDLLLGALALTCLFLTTSRGGLLSLAAAVLLILGLTAWFKSEKQSLTGGFLSVVCLVLVAAVVLALLGGQQTAQRLSETDPLSEDRLKIFAAYWPTFKASPWLGYGLGAFRSWNGLSMNHENATTLAILGAAHNVYLQWLLQEGAPGAAAMIGSVALVVMATIRGVARRAGQQSLGLACLGVTAVFAVHGLVDFALETPSTAAFFSAILGLGYGLAERPAGGRRS